MIRYRELEDILFQNHVLIAGATGSGKSVIENDLLYHCMFYTPEQVSLALIDPKRIELYRYKNLPHVIGYETEPNKAVNLLKHCENIMMQRYDIMQRCNSLKWAGNQLFIFIDEWAPLTLVSDKKLKKAIEDTIQNIAQLGRAAGVHLVLCTQYIITLNTRIRCNFDNRIALRCACVADSKKLIDVSGAELLPRYGEMLYSSAAGLKHLKVPFIDQNTIQTGIDHWTPKPKKRTRLK